MGKTNTTVLDAMECEPENKAKCEPFGRCRVVPDESKGEDSCAFTEVCECTDVDGSVSQIPFGANDTCVCTGSRCQFPFCSAQGSNCTETCGVECDCLPGFVGPACSCNVTAPARVRPQLQKRRDVCGWPACRGKSRLHVH